MIILVMMLILLVVAKVVNTVGMMRDEREDGADETAPKNTRKDSHIKYEYPAPRKTTHTDSHNDNTHTDKEVRHVEHNPRDKLIRNYKTEYKEWKRSLEQYERLRSHFI